MVNPFIIFIKVGVLFISVSYIFNVSVPEFVRNFSMFYPTNDNSGNKCLLASRRMLNVVKTSL
jgi:hypothetical protein